MTPALAGYASRHGTIRDPAPVARSARPEREAHAEADRASEAKSQFLANMSHELRRLFVSAGLLLCACGGDDSASRADTPAPAFVARAAMTACYRSDRSVMGRESPLTGARSTAPGWIRVELQGASDSGAALIVDADGAALEGSWTGADSAITVLAADDFLRVTLHLTKTDSGLAGRGLATSDAELVRDSTGRLRELRREWSLAARPAPCDSVPGRAGRDGR